MQHLHICMICNCSYITLHVLNYNYSSVIVMKRKSEHWFRMVAMLLSYSTYTHTHIYIYIFRRIEQVILHVLQWSISRCVK
jgi:hypothetical protein